MKSVEQLDVFKLAHELALEVYKIPLNSRSMRALLLWRR